MSSWADDVLSGKSRWAVTQGDCLAVLADLPPDSVSLVFGSPPYVAARLYLEGGSDLGIARGAEEWSAWMCQVYAACLRVCPGLTGMVVEGQTRDFAYDAAPALLMADLARSGVTLRKPPIYRRVGIPGSGGPDWLRNDYEWIIAATRGGKLPWSDNTACGHPPKFSPGRAMSYRTLNGEMVNVSKNPWNVSGKPKGGRRPDGHPRSTERSTAHCAKYASPRKPDGSPEPQPYGPPAIANPGNVIDCKAGGGLMGSNLSHLNEAPFSEDLAKFFVKSFCPPDGIVFDPFAGSGTTLSVAVQEGRRALGCDIRASQVELVRRRLDGVTPGLFAS